MKILFVCSANIDRSPTAERIYSGKSNLEVKSAGTADYAQTPVSVELIQWADVILCMEKKHKQRIEKKFPSIVADKTIASIGVPDIFAYMDNNLIDMIREKADAWLCNYYTIEKSRD